MLTLDHGLNTSENSEVQAQTPPLKKAASELGLHYFLCRINATPAVKGLTALGRANNFDPGKTQSISPSHLDRNCFNLCL